MCKACGALFTRTANVRTQCIDHCLDTHVGQVDTVEFIDLDDYEHALGLA